MSDTLDNQLAALRDTVAALAERIETVSQMAQSINLEHLMQDERLAALESRFDTLAMADIDVIESPASALEPDPLCQNCGHEKSFHPRSWTGCLHSPSSHSPYCSCFAFVPAQAEPATAHQEPPDPVLAVLPPAPRVDEITIPRELAELLLEYADAVADINAAHDDHIASNEANAAAARVRAMLEGAA